MRAPTADCCDSHIKRNHEKKVFLLSTSDSALPQARRDPGNHSHVLCLKLTGRRPGVRPWQFFDSQVRTDGYSGGLWWR